jgi:hypothetical protein
MKVKQLHSLLSLLTLMLVAACSAIAPADPAGTLQANQAAYALEGTSIAQAAQAQGTEVMATAAAAETHVSAAERVNQQLMLTLRAVVPPTQQLVNEGEAFTPGAAASPAPGGVVGAATPLPPGGGAGGSGTLFTQVGTALEVRDADGCAVELVSGFAADVQRIYVTTRALNVRSGTTMRVQWNYEGQPSFEETYTVPSDDDDFCLWFYIEPTGEVFGAGSWTVQLYADVTAIDPLVSFTVGV